jgi:hypothetical protein
MPYSENPPISRLTCYLAHGASWFTLLFMVSFGHMENRCSKFSQYFFPEQHENENKADASGEKINNTRESGESV